MSGEIKFRFQNGRLEQDFSGFSGKSCHAARKRLEKLFGCFVAIKESEVIEKECSSEDEAVVIEEELLNG